MTRSNNKLNKCGELLPQPYAGTVVMAGARNIVYGYHGEFFRNQGQASQWAHFYDNGLFVGQFGTPYDPAVERNGLGAVPGFSALSYHPTFVRVDASNNEPSGNAPAETYIWADDFSSHSGTIRWHLLGADQILEKTGTVPSPGSATLTDVSPSTWPTGLTATPGNGQITLSWAGVSGVSNYVVKMSTTSGGPYTTTVPVSGMTYTWPGLTNGSLYYFVVTASGSPRNSNEVRAYPFNVVGRAGRLTGGPIYPWQVMSSGPILGTASLGGISDLIGNTALTSVGSKGYLIFNWKGGDLENGAGNVTNLAPNFSISLGGAWVDQNTGANSFVIDGKSGEDACLLTNSSGTVQITVPDTNVHYVTVFSPSVIAPSSELHSYELKLTSSNQAITPAIQSVNEVGEFHRVFQFAFTGNVTLTMTKTGNGRYDTTLQAIFID